MTSTILTKLAETYPQVLTNPESIMVEVMLGPNYLKVLELWEHIEGLSEQEREEMYTHYWDLDCNVRWSAIDAARDAATEVVGEKFRNEAWDAACDVTGRWVFGDATLELIGGVENKVFYNLIMSHKQP